MKCILTLKEDDSNQTELNLSPSRDNPLAANIKQNGFREFMTTMRFIKSQFIYAHHRYLPNISTQNTFNFKTI
jgi:hypothetical protein